MRGLGPVLLGVLFAAVGQLLLKVGASGRGSLAEYLNCWIAGGLVAYGLGTALWVLALSRLPLTAVYPFTALTFVLVYLAGLFLLGEQTTPRALLGVALILVGLFLVSSRS